MFALTTKAKIAAGIAAGALTLGAAGAYAAANANNTVSLTGAKPVTITVTGSTTPAPALLSLNGKTATITATFNDPGQCVSTFAQDKSLVLNTTAATVSKNYHGKLMSTIHSWCQQFKSTTTGSSAEAPDTTQSAAPETEQSDAPQSGAAHGHSKH
ncbi:MAG TPA: hypothetical protein VIT43_10400 [Candidatus Dormibacteraeota bacterium]